MTAIIRDIISIFFVLALGYFSGRRNAFSQVQAAGFNKLVLNYALPATLFVSIANSTRERLFSDTSMLLVSIIVLVSWHLIAFVIAKKVFRHTTQESGIAGLSAGAPTVGFLAIAVLSPLLAPRRR